MTTQTIAPDAVQLDRAANAAQLPPAVRAGLADPSARIAVTTVTRDGGRRLDCYAVAGAGKQLAAVTPDAEGGAAVSFPVDGALAEALIVETLGLDQPLAPVDHRSELDIAALWALAAMADAHRQAELESLLARTPARQVALNEDSIYLRALDGATLPDPRWLSGMLTQIFGPGDVTEARLLAGPRRAGARRADRAGEDGTVVAATGLRHRLRASRIAARRRGAVGRPPAGGRIQFSVAGILAQLRRRLGHRTARRGRSADRGAPQLRQRRRCEDAGA